MINHAAWLARLECVESGGYLFGGLEDGTLFVDQATADDEDRTPTSCRLGPTPPDALGCWHTQPGGNYRPSAADLGAWGSLATTRAAWLGVVVSPAGDRTLGTAYVIRQLGGEVVADPTRLLD